MYKWLQVEATTKCNAWCPGCGRNQGGYGLVPDLVLEDLKESVFEQHLKNLPDLEVIDFCGTYGDAVAAYNIKLLTEIAKQYAKKIIVRTNGSLRNTIWWVQYANILKDHDHEVWFCLDGLADTHSIYRQGTDFNTIIDNAKTFMSAGGTAVWQFIPWKHNEHQIKDCLKLSQQLGFKRFEFIRDVRKDFDARDYRSGAAVTILPWKDDVKFNKFEKTRTSICNQDCRHLSQPSLYLNANGKISPCCFFNLHRSVDSIVDLPDISNELLTDPHNTCIKFCSK
jgi:MoaA/NifB/PqqE/SkfB family radical SAM enzyme